MAKLSMEIDELGRQDSLPINFGGRKFSAEELLAEKKTKKFDFFWKFVYLANFFDCFVAILGCKPAYTITSW